MTHSRFQGRDPHGPRVGFRVAIVELMKMRWSAPAPSGRRRKQREPAELGVEDDPVFLTTPGVLRVYATEEHDFGAWTTRDYLLAGNGTWGIPVPNHPDFLVARLPLHGEVFESEAGLLWATPTRVVEIFEGFARRALSGTHGCAVYPLEEGLREFAFEEALDLLVGDSYDYDLNGRFAGALIERLTAECAATKLETADEDVCRRIAERVHQALHAEVLAEDAMSG